MSEVHMSAALHASDRPAKQQLSPNNAMQVPTNDTTIIPWQFISTKHLCAKTQLSKFIISIQLVTCSSNEHHPSAF